MKFNLRIFTIIALSIFLLQIDLASQYQSKALQVIQDTVEEDPKYALKLIDMQFNQSPSDSQKVWLTNLKGSSNVSLKNLIEAKKTFDEAINLAVLINDTNLIFQSRINAAQLQFRNGNYSNCFEYYLENLKMVEYSNHCNLKPKAALNVGTMYYYLKNKDKCLELLQEGYELAIDCNDSAMVQLSCQNMAAMYSERAEKQKTIYWMEKGLTYLDPNNYGRKAHSYSILSAVYEYPAEKDRMKYLVDKALEYARMTSDSSMVAFCSIKKSNYYIAAKNLDSASYYAKYALDIYRTEKIMDGMLHANAYLSRLGMLESDPHKAIKALQGYISISDSIYTEVALIKATELETKYETEKKETENALLKKTNQLKQVQLDQEKSEKLQQALIFLGVVLGLLSFGVFLFYQRKLRSNQRISKLEKQNFTAIIEAEENERGRIAKELHDGLGQLLSTAKLNVAATEESVAEADRLLVKTSMNLIDDAVSEVRSISHNLMPIALSQQGLKIALEDLADKINNSNTIKVILSISDLGNLITKSTEVTIYRIIQEVLNNSLKHSKATEIHIELIAHSNSISLNISDNGSGFDTKKIKESKGIGWANIFSRISLINGKINVNSSKDSGTHLSIQIPLA